MTNEEFSSDRKLDTEESTRRSLLKLAGVSGLALTASAAPSLARSERSTGSVESPAPGPELLYTEADTPPQFETPGVWNADPLLVSGADAYVSGEYLYQSFSFDDYGAHTGYEGEQPPSDTFSIATGDIAYPTDVETYGHNAADLLEFRVTKAAGALRYRITLNTMIEPDVAGIAIGIDRGGDSGSGGEDWGYGLGSLGDLALDDIVVTWGPGAELRDMESGETTTLESTVDLERNQIEVTVPLDPGEETWRHYLVCGLFDPDEGAFKQIQPQPTETHPGGSMGQNPPPVFSTGFRRPPQEPMGDTNLDPEAAEEQVESAIEGLEGGQSNYGTWREHSQAQALSERDISEFFADIDFGKLGRNVTEYNVPETGWIDRLYGSRFEIGQGVGTTEDDEVIMRGRIQPYGLYVPSTYDSEESAPLLVAMHGSTANHNQWPVFSPNYLRQLGEQRGALILSPQGRGPSLSYEQESELDVMEAISDVASRYAVDFEQITLSGYSMGGFGTFTIGGLYPDLVAKGFPIVGAGDEALLDNVRHVPMLMWNASNDELVGPQSYVPTQQRLQELGYRHELDTFLGYDHFMHGLRDQWGPGKEFLEGEFLGDETVERSPMRFTYRRVPSYDLEEYGLVHDSVYWVADIRIADDVEDGLIDVHSKATGDASPVTADYQDLGTDPDPHTKHGTRWRESIVDEPPQNGLDLTLDGVTEATIYVDEGGLDAKRPLELTIDASHAATLELVSQYGTETISVPAGQHEQTVTVQG